MTTDLLSDEELVVAYQTSQCQVAASEIMSRYWEPLVRTLSARLDTHTAEDVAQNTMVNTFLHIDKFDPEKESLFVWILYMAKTKRTDEYRRRKNRPTTLGDVGTEMINHLESREDAPDGDAMGYEADERFWQCVDALSREDRTLVCLAFIEGLPACQVAREMGINRHTVKRRLQRLSPVLRREVGYDTYPADRRKQKRLKKIAA